MGTAWDVDPDDLGPRLDAVRRDVLSRIERLARDLEAGEARFRDVLLWYPSGVIVVDEDGVISFVNPAAEAILGRPTHELRGARFGIPTGGRTSEVHVLLPGGGTRVAQIRTTVVAWEGVRAHVVSLQDVTDRAIAHEALEASNERLRLAVEFTGDGLWDWDVAHNRVFYSDAWFRMLGLPPREASEDPQTWLGRVHPDDLEGLVDRLREALAGTSNRFEAAYRIRTADGRYRPMLCRAGIVRDPDGRAVRVTGFQADASGVVERGA